MNYFQFTFEQLKVLRKIQKELSFQDTAEQLNISQPNVTLQLQRLESQFNDQLFDRNKAELNLTLIGHIVLNYTCIISQLYNEADKSIRFIKKLRKINVTIGSSHLLGEYFLPKLIELFCRYYSSFFLKLEIQSNDYITWEVLNGKLDIGLVVEEEIPVKLYDSLLIIPYSNEEIVLILPRSYKLKGNSLISLKQLYSFDFIGLNPNLLETKLLNSMLKKNDISSRKLKIKFEVNSLEAAIRGVQAGLGVSFAPILAVREKLIAKRIQIARVCGKKIYKRLSVVINPRVHLYLSSVQFYNFFFFVTKIDSYIRFLNLKI